MDPILSVRTWALHLHALRALRAQARRHVAVQPMQASAARSTGSNRGTVAVVPVYGPMMQHGSVWDEFFGLASMDAIAARLAGAVADPGVQSIVLDVSSPGGEVYGSTELAGAVRAAAAAKPVVAVANSLAASAAYWAISGASEIMVSPSAEIGSIGVYAVHEDWSAALDQEGIKVTLVSDGEGKTDGNPYEPLSEEALADLQASVTRMYGMFVADVAKGRGVSAATVKGKWGAHLYGAKESVEMGMADKVGTLADGIERASRLKVKAPSAGAAATLAEALRIRS